MSDALTINFSEIPRQKNTPAFVIGNGISRMGLDLNLLRNRGIIFGCNYLLKDYDFLDCPFFLFSQDHAPVSYITRKKFVERGGNLILPKAVLNHPMVKDISRYIIIDKTIGSTGHNALNHAIQLGCDPIVLIGMGDRFKKVQEYYTDNIYNYGNSLIKAPMRVYKDHIQRQCQEYKTHREWPQLFVKMIEATNALVISTNPDNIMKVPAIPYEELIDLFPPVYGCKPTFISNSSWTLPARLDSVPTEPDEPPHGASTGR